MLDLLRSVLSSPGFKVPDALRRKVILAALLLVVALVAVTGYHLGHHAGLRVGADQPGWENAILATTISFRAKIAFALGASAIVMAVGAFQVLDRSALGKRLFHWSKENDTPYTEAAKTLSSSLVFGALVLGVFTLAAAVLR